MSTHAIRIATEDRLLVEAADFYLPKDRIVFLFGESGIGKSLLSQAVFGLLDKRQLDIRINEQPYAEYLRSPFISALRRQGFYVFQEPSSHLNPAFALHDQIRDAVPGQDDHLPYILDKLKLRADILPVFPSDNRPSGGEKQRVLLAMAFQRLLARQDKTAPGWFVFDEPSGNLDYELRDRVIDLLLDEFRRLPFAALVITHDYSLISYLATHHADALSSVDFRELRRAAPGRVELHPFAYDEYLGWLAAQRPQPVDPGKSPLLSLSSGYKTIGRRFSLRQNGEITSLQIFPGQIVYLKAASGVGKTTLARVISGRLKVENLGLRFGELEISEKQSPRFWQKHIWGQRLSMVFQHADEALNLNATVRQTLRLVSAGHKKSNAGLMEALEILFTREEVMDIFKRKAAHLSGGQKQRLNLLRSFLTPAPLIILDEPFNGLDFQNLQRCVSFFREQQIHGRAMLLITHDEDIARVLTPPQMVFKLEAE